MTKQSWLRILMLGALIGFAIPTWGAPGERSFAAGQSVISTVDSTGDVGRGTSLALNVSGNPVISYFDATTGALKVVVCGDATCSSGNVTSIVDSVTVSPNGALFGQYTSLALNASGNPVVSYYNAIKDPNGAANGDLKVAVCGNATCTGGNTITTVDSVGDVGRYASLALNVSGNPVISYYDDSAGNRALKVAVCGDATCSSGNVTTTIVDGLALSGAVVGQFTSIALNASGNPVVSYFDGTNQDLKVVVCGSATCASGNVITSHDTANMSGRYSSIALNASGIPVVSYYDANGGDLKLLVCGDATCSPASDSITTIDSTGAVGTQSSMRLNAVGNPVVSYYDATSTNQDLKVAVCGDATCSAGTIISAPDTAGNVGQYTSLRLNAVGNPVVSYYDATNGDLKLLVCGTCTELPTATPAPSATATETPAATATPTATSTPVATSTSTATSSPTETASPTQTATAAPTSTSTPSATPTSISIPTSADQCKNAGWQVFGIFKNQGDCVSFVASAGKNLPAK